MTLLVNCDMITPENIEQKLVGLQEQLNTLQANINAVAGAIQFAKQLLEEARATAHKDKEQ